MKRYVVLRIDTEVGDNSTVLRLFKTKKEAVKYLTQVQKGQNAATPLLDHLYYKLDHVRFLDGVKTPVKVEDRTNSHGNCSCYKYGSSPEGR